MDRTKAVSRLHHINFLVRDIERAVEFYSTLLNREDFIREEIRSRGVLTARIRLGDTWLVLVQPTDENSEPARHLRKHGEGFFLASFQSSDLSSEVARLGEAGIEMQGNERRGLEDWLVQDIASAHTYGAKLQLCEKNESGRSNENMT